jgi:ribonuclease HI
LSGARARAWMDGASRGNPGDAGFGVVFETDGEAEELYGFLGRTTNNVAEYVAVLATLALAARRGVERLTLYTDSQLVVRQLSGNYRVKAPHLVPLFLKVLKLRRSFAGFEIHHVTRSRNRRADALANRAIDERAPLPSWLDVELPGP